MQPVFLAVKYNCPITLGKDASGKLLLHRHQTNWRCLALWIIPLKTAAYPRIKCVEIVVAPLPTGPVNLRKRRFNAGISVQLVHSLVERDDFTAVASSSSYAFVPAT